MVVSPSVVAEIAAKAKAEAEDARQREDYMKDTSVYQSISPQARVKLFLLGLIGE